jgi:hypothetical protein
LLLHELQIVLNRSVDHLLVGEGLLTCLGGEGIQLLVYLSKDSFYQLLLVTEHNLQLAEPLSLLVQ